MVKQWLKNTRGAASIEYVLLISAIGIAIAAIVFTMGDTLVEFFNAASESIEE